LKRRSTNSDFHTLRLTCGGIIPYRSKTGMHGVRLHQPTKGSIAYISRCFPEHKVSRVDVALDLIAIGWTETGAIAARLNATMTQPWRGNRRTHTEKSTLYLAARTSRRNVALYADRPSKVTGEPAVHVEFRYTGTAACKRRGIYHIGDLLNFDPGICLQRDMRISVLNLRKLDRLVAALARELEMSHTARRRRYAVGFDRRSMRRRIRGLICRVLADGDRFPEWHELEHLPVQKCMDAGGLMRLAAEHVSGRVLVNKQQFLFWS
jgi:hypothetical protein